MAGSFGAFAFPSISNDYVLVIDTSEMMGSNINWVLDSYSNLVKNQIAPLADGPGEINVGVVIFGQRARQIIGLTDAYTHLDAIVQALGTRYISPISEGASNSSEGIDVARSILSQGHGFRKMILLSTRYFANTWNTETRNVPCAPGANSICARVAFQNACADANRDGYEIWGLEISHFTQDELPAQEDYPYALQQCVVRAERFAQASNSSDFLNFTKAMIQPGLTACVNVGFLDDLDRNINDRVDTPEFFNALDFWIGGCVPDSTFFIIVDLWINGKPISSSDLRTRIHTRPQSLALTTTLTKTQFTVRAESATSIDLNLFSLSGQRIFNQSQNGQTLRWNLLTANGAPLSNGVYLAQIIARGIHGEIVSIETKKIVVMH